MNALCLPCWSISKGQTECHNTPPTPPRKKITSSWSALHRTWSIKPYPTETKHYSKHIRTNSGCQGIGTTVPDCAHRAAECGVDRHENRRDGLSSANLQEDIPDERTATSLPDAALGGSGTLLDTYSIRITTTTSAIITSCDAPGRRILAAVEQHASHLTLRNDDSQILMWQKKGLATKCLRDCRESRPSSAGLWARADNTHA